MSSFGEADKVTTTTEKQLMQDAVPISKHEITDQVSAKYIFAAYFFAFVVLGLILIKSLIKK